MAYKTTPQKTKEWTTRIPLKTGGVDNAMNAASKRQHAAAT
jgi:hypothetical protein